MKRIVALCLALLCLNRALLCSNKLVITNYTLKPLYVAQVRTAARTQYKQYVGHPSQYDEVMIIPIDAFSVATVDADGESGYLKYDRVLWVSDSLVSLQKALITENRGPYHMSVDALYLGRNQAGAKYIVYDRDAKRFSFAQDADRALAILEKDLEKHTSRYDSEKLRNTIAPRDANYDLLPLSSLSSAAVMNSIQAEHARASTAVLKPSLKSR